MELALAIFTFLSSPTGQQVLKVGVETGAIAISDVAKLVGAVLPHAHEQVKAQAVSVQST